MSHNPTSSMLSINFPALRKPTVSPLYGDSGFALEIIVEDKTSRDLIPRLKRAGAEGIVEYSLSKVIH
jgi:ATP phosphoribosyltransferase